jgi:hypothetical protein
MPIQSNPLRRASRKEVAPIYLEQNLDLIYRSWREDRRGITIPTIWLALVLSLLIHLAAVWPWHPPVLRPSSEQSERESGRSSLSVQLAPRPTPAPERQRSPAVQPQLPPQARAQRPRVAPRARAEPNVLALNRAVPNVPPALAPAIPIVPAPTTPAPIAPRAAPAGDLASYIEAKRQARDESAPSAPSVGSASNTQPAEDDNARANRIAAANLGTDRTPTFGADRGGGIFSIQRMSYDYAEFLFFGWNKDIRRNTTQLIEVRKGTNSDIRLAVVRRMIVIIREHEDGDFVFESRRLGRNITLSARPRDTAGLEDFLMREFFGDANRP